MSVEEVVRVTGVPKSSVVRILATLRSEGLAVHDSSTRTCQATRVLVENNLLPLVHMGIGGDDWNKTQGPCFIPFLSNGAEGITTYGLNGDADMGVMWRFVPGETGFDRLRFMLHGGHASVLLVKGSTPVPTEGDFPVIYRDLVGGKFGEVVEEAKGPDANDREVMVNWDLSRHGGAPLKIVVIDALNEPWGFVSVSRLTLERPSSPRRRESGSGDRGARQRAPVVSPRDFSKDKGVLV